MDTHFLDLKETIQLPSERCVLQNPSASALAALDATLAIAKNAILCDNPTLQELMNRVENNEDLPLHLFSVHNIVDTIDRLRLTIHTYNKQIDEYLEKQKTKNLPF